MAIKVRQEINILDNIILSSNATTIRSEEKILYEPLSNWNNAVCYLEIVAKNVSVTYTISVDLKPESGPSDVVITVPANTTSWTRFRSASFAVTNCTPGQNAKLQLQYVASSNDEDLKIKCARVVILQNCGVSNLTATVSQFEIGNYEIWASEVVNNPLVYPKYWKYESAKWDGTTNFYFHFSAAVENSMDYGAYNLQVDNGSFGGWANVFGSDFQVTSVDAIYVGDYTATYKFTPIDGRHYRLVIHNENDMNNVMIYNAKIICKQTDAEITKFQTEYLIANTEETGGTGLKDYDTYFVPAEWEDVDNDYFHEHYASGAASQTKLQEDPNGVPADITNSGITGANLQRGSAMTMPGSAEEIDVNVVAIS